MTRGLARPTRALSVVVITWFVLSAVLAVIPRAQAQTAIGFTKSALKNETSSFPTSLQFGPDGKLYVAQFNGQIKVYSVSRSGANNYTVTGTQTITSVQNIQNHNDNGANASVSNRLVTGLLVAGTAQNPVIYVTSSDPRIGGGADGEDLNLDTNSGIISRLTWNGSSWVKLDLVRGLPRSEENHTANGMALDKATNTLYVAQGGNTNQGAPSNNFARLPEFALSAAILSVNLTAIGNSTYDLPTLNDENRSGNPDANDPFGGNNGKNQAKIVSGGPVQVFSPGYRNPYDVIITTAGKMYTIDNGSNGGWGGKPANEGPNGNCTNAISEPGDNDPDHLHLITGKGYYGGHPNPARGNKSNTFNTSIPQSPIGTENPVECDYRDPATTADGNLTTFAGSTNGIAQYTTNNFSGAMTGDLLTAGYSKNTVYRVKLNSTGTGVVSNTTLFSNVGGKPLDITTQGSTGAFPGTIWVADTNGTIHVFEPNDFGGGGGGGGCTGADNASIDEDGDGFDNADEIDNGTNPCSSADVPPDWDGDETSNLNDPNDDNDGMPDTSDPFAIDPANGLTTDIPVRYGWENDAPNPGGILGLGFTGLMTNGTANYEALYDEDKMTAGGAAGVTTVEAVPAGDALNAGNSQQYGFQFGVDPPSSGSFTAHTRIVSPFAGLTPQNYQSMGLFLGPGNQDNYVRIATAAQNGTGIQFRKEVGGGTTNSRKHAVALPGPSSVDLYLTVNVGTAKVQPSYAITTGGVTGTRKNLGSALSVPSSWFSSGLAIGIISTSRGPGPVFPATWDLIEVASGTGSTSTSVEAAATGGWIQRAPSGPTRQEVSYVNAGNKLYLTGGTTAHEVYDPSTNAWSTVRALPARLNHIQGVAVGGKIYYIGGLASWPSPHVSTVYIYDPASDTFTQGAPMPRGRGAGGVAVHNGKIYYAGGLHDGVAVPWFDEYDPATNSWRQLPNMPRAKDHFHAAVVNGLFFAIGGRQSSSSNCCNATLAANDAFNFSTGNWSSNRAPLPTKRGGFAAAVLGDEILIIGGEGGGKAWSTVEAYDVSSNTWRTLAPMPTARHGIQAAVCNGGVYIAAGGTTQGGGNPTDVHQAFFLDGQTTCGSGGGSSSEVAEDTFGRTVASGWGTADVGGSWSVTNGGSSSFAVNGSAGTVSTPSGTGQRVAVLGATSVRDVTVQAEVRFGSAVSGSGKLFADLLFRRQGTAHYRIGLNVNAKGVLMLRAQTNAGAKVFGPVSTGLTYAPGDVIVVKAQAVGAGPTTLRAKAWRLGSAEPAGWAATSTNAASGLQSAGSVGVRVANTSGTSSSVIYDDLIATRAA